MTVLKTLPKPLRKTQPKLDRTAGAAFVRRWIKRSRELREELQRQGRGRGDAT